MVDWVSWVTFGIKNSKELKQILSSLRQKFLGKESRIAITGMEGIGKTVLLHALTGEDKRPGYRPPTVPSQAKESGKVKAAGRKLLLHTVPGQPAEPRDVTLDELFDSDKPVDGVIHVVGGGLAVVRQENSARVLVEDKGIATIEDLRKYGRKREREDMQVTCKAIQKSHRKHHAPKWLLVAVDKIDLYFDTLRDEIALYSPEARSGIPKLLNDLAKAIGTSNFRWETVPVCGRLEGFTWNGHDLRPQLDEQARQAFLANFLTHLESYCL